MISKVCTKCKASRSIEDYRMQYCQKRNATYESNICRLCANEQARLSARRNQRARILRVFNITEVDYEIMLKLQNGVCAICSQINKINKAGKIRPLSVDHDHKTGIVRKLLCDACNHMLGKAKDNPEILEKAANYLRKHNEQSKSPGDTNSSPASSTDA